MVMAFPGGPRPITLIPDRRNITPPAGDGREGLLSGFWEGFYRRLELPFPGVGPATVIHAEPAPANV
jgi:hypothetical protein